MYKLSNKCSLCQKSFATSRTVFVRKNSKSKGDKVSTSELAQGYVPHEVECLKKDENYFLPPKNSEKVFSMVFPPPNVTGDLHLGHALTAAVQDTIIRWKKMQGFSTVWIPGLDHAGIATQVVVEKSLLKEKGLTRHEIGREKFVEEVLKWKESKSTKINEQLKQLNVSLDWHRELFTMDCSTSRAVKKAFITLFEKGLIYRADQLVNWSCVLQSAISDVEVEHINIERPTKICVPGYEKPVEFGYLSRFAYKIKDSDEEIVVATTRPETMIADVAVAVHPNDERYSRYHGKKLLHPFRNEEIPVICDEFVDPNFGTGAVKITPAHDVDDFEVGKRHGLPTLQVIDEMGNLTTLCKDFAGLKRFDARQIILNELANKKLFKGSDSHSTSVPLCSRSKDVVEQLLKPQWFVDCRKIAERAIRDVKEGRIVIQPVHFERVWFTWLENIRDWCVSRQLWWGHRIPVYLCNPPQNKNNTVWFAAESLDSAKEKSAKYFDCPSQNIEIYQDEDVLDTWFSSALLPIAAFGWPETTQDFGKCYPLSIMETGHDILFFWVARMVMLCTELTGKSPFDNILLHGIICDSRGRKMSKSLGNVIDPQQIILGCTLEELEQTINLGVSRGILSKEEGIVAKKEQKKVFPLGIPECGSDALKFTLLSHNIKSHYISFEVGECHANKLFGNKVWQATKFALRWCRVVPNSRDLRPFDGIGNVAFADAWILSRLAAMVDVVRAALPCHDFHVAASSVKNFMYYELCDVYLECSKRGLKENSDLARSHAWTLLKCLDVSLRIMYLFMPILAQHLHEHLPLTQKELGFPTKINLRNKEVENELQEILDVVVTIRRLKKIFNVTAKHKPEVHLITPKNFHQHSTIISDLASLQKLTISHDIDTLQIKHTVKDNVGESSVYLTVPEELKNALTSDTKKIEEQERKIRKELAKMEKMMSGDTYATNATAEAQTSHAKKVSALNDKLNRLKYIRSISL